MSVKYMHTLDGKPATFTDGERVVFSSRIKLADSLKQIRREQFISKNSYRRLAHDGENTFDSVEYGYTLVVQ